LGLGLLLAALLAACSGPGAPGGGLPELLLELGFSERQPSTQPPARNFSKSVQGVTLWAALPAPPRRAGRGPVLLIKANGPDGGQGAATDQALLTRPEVGRLVQAASQGVYPPQALKEVLDQALAGAARPPGHGAVITSPKGGFSLSVPFAQGHLRLVALVRHAARP
jgi:hypothetical protein